MEYNQTRYNLLTITERLKGSMAVCKCDCGQTLTVHMNKLEQGQKNHCGAIECRRKLREIRVELRGKWRMSR